MRDLLNDSTRSVHNMLKNKRPVDGLVVVDTKPMMRKLAGLRWLHCIEVDTVRYYLTVEWVITLLHIDTLIGIDFFQNKSRQIYTDLYDMFLTLDQFLILLATDDAARDAFLATLTLIYPEGLTEVFPVSRTHGVVAGYDTIRIAERWYEVLCGVVGSGIYPLRIDTNLYRRLW